MPRLNLAQRVVAVVALGMLLWLVGHFLSAPAGPTGWTGYAPLQRGSIGAIGFASFPRDGLLPFENLLVWFGLVLGWFAGSALLLRGPRPRTRPRPHVEPAGARGGEGPPVDAGTAPTGD